jgi:hypothetical protein
MTAQDDKSMPPKPFDIHADQTGLIPLVGDYIDGGGPSWKVIGRSFRNRGNGEVEVRMHLDPLV